MKFPAGAPGQNQKLASERLGSADAMSALRAIFEGYLASKRVLAADLDRIVLKGWPDRTPAVRAHSRAIRLVMEREMLRFEYLLSHVPLESSVWTSLDTVLKRLSTDWPASDEKMLSDANATYRDTVTRLEAAERSRTPAELDDPIKDARRDSEYRKAAELFSKSNDELDSQFSALRRKWPEPRLR